MANVVVADYGFTKTNSGQETRFAITQSRQAKKIAALSSRSLYAVLFIICAIPGGSMGGDANSFSVGLFWTVVFFLVTATAIKLIAGTFRVIFSKGSPTIIVAPSTITILNRTYDLKDVRNWRIGNSHDEKTTIYYRPSQAVTRDAVIAASYYIAFSYGQEDVKAAINLSASQADALLQEIMSTLERHAGSIREPPNKSPAF